MAGWKCICTIIEHTALPAIHKKPRQIVGVLKDKLDFPEKSPNEDWVNKM